MVRIRLRRTGLKGQPSYRIIAADKESPRDGRFLEILGSYNPRTRPFTLDMNEARVYSWLSTGAQPSESVLQLFNSIGVMERFARFKAGEKVEVLVAEGKTANEGRVEKPKAHKVKVKKEE